MFTFFLVVLALPAVAQEQESKQVPSALSSKLIKKITDEVNSDTERLQEIFKDLHQNPELGFMETRTAGIVARELNALGYEVKTGIAKTGVVGICQWPLVLTPFRPLILTPLQVGF